MRTIITILAILTCIEIGCTTAKPKRSCGDFVPNAELLKDSSFHGDYYRKLVRLKYSVDSMINEYK